MVPILVELNRESKWNCEARAEPMNPLNPTSAVSVKPLAFSGIGLCVTLVHPRIRTLDDIQLRRDRHDFATCLLRYEVERPSFGIIKYLLEIFRHDRQNQAKQTKKPG